MLDRPTLSELIERAVGDIEVAVGGVDASTRRTVARALATAMAGYAHGLYGYIDWVARQVFPDTADTDSLDRHAALWGMARRPARYAQGVVAVTGLADSIIAEGTLVRCGGQQYRVLAETVIPPGGGVSVPVSAIDAGLAGNQLAGATVHLTTAVSGVQSAAVVGDGGLTGGADEEADGALRQRIMDRIANAPGGGTAADYRRWAMTVAGVTRAWVRPGAAGPGTVRVYFCMDLAYPPHGIPQAGDVATVQAALDASRPVTATVIASPPTAKAVDVTIEGLLPATQEVKNAVAAELVATMARVGEPGLSLSRSHVGQAISSAVGEMRHKLAVPADDVPMLPGEIPVLGEITWL